MHAYFVLLLLQVSHQSTHLPVPVLGYQYVCALAATLVRQERSRREPTQGFCAAPVSLSDNKWFTMSFGRDTDDKQAGILLRVDDRLATNET